MSGQIFISYRREDSAGFAGRLYDRLRDRFGEDRIFMDVSGIKLGLDFVEEIDKAVGSSRALIALIGKNWLDAKDVEGNRRLDHPEDFVRLEILSALERGIRVIPTLVGGAVMPTSEDLPEPLKPLARRQGCEISHIGFDQDVTRLIRTIEDVLAEAQSESSSTQPQPKAKQPQKRQSPINSSKTSLWNRLPAWGQVVIPIVGIALIVGIIALISVLGNGPRQPAQNFEHAIKDKVGIPMVLVPAGKFEMGDTDGEPNEQPAHSVVLDAYYIDQFEVTNAQYALCVDAGVCDPPEDTSSVSREEYYGNPEFDDYPVVNLYWNQADAFCQWRDGRLPTEAEWEKAARGGNEGMEYPWGEDHPVCETGVENGANFDDDLACDGKDTDPVGTYNPNELGLFDVAGNVWEFVSDFYDPNMYEAYAAGVENPTGPQSGGAHVVRGGSFEDDFSALRVALRSMLPSETILASYGFRCVLDIEP